MALRDREESPDHSRSKHMTAGSGCGWYSSRGRKVEVSCANRRYLCAERQTGLSAAADWRVRFTRYFFLCFPLRGRFYLSGGGTESLGSAGSETRRSSDCYSAPVSHLWWLLRLVIAEIRWNVSWRAGSSELNTNTVFTTRPMWEWLSRGDDKICKATLASEAEAAAGGWSPVIAELQPLSCHVQSLLPTEIVLLNSPLWFLK